MQLEEPGRKGRSYSGGYTQSENERRLVIATAMIYDATTHKRSVEHPDNSPICYERAGRPQGRKTTSRGARFELDGQGAT
jgi:hypothetical protein